MIAPKRQFLCSPTIQIKLFSPSSFANTVSSCYPTIRCTLTSSHGSCCATVSSSATLPISMLSNMCSSGLQSKLLYVKYGDAVSNGTNTNATTNADANAVSNADADAVSNAATNANATTVAVHCVWLLHGSSTCNYPMDANILPSHLQTTV